jgi:cytochrome b561
MERTNTLRYSAPTKAIHWLTAVLVLTAFIYGPGGSEERIYSAARDFDRQLHETLGVCVLALVLVRVLWRFVDRHPEPPPLARWMGLAAIIVRVTLYVLLFAVPLTGLSGAWLEGHPLTLLGPLAVPPPLPRLHALGSGIADVHSWLGDVIIWVAGVHAAAGLFHHYVLKDGMLLSMLPGRGSTR